MAPKDPCAKYQYILTKDGPKILPVSDHQSKDDSEESPADYNPGGYLPVHVGDTFKHGRYTVIRKLGWGHFSTVWLVKDTELNRHSALKVVKSAGRYAETALDEIKLLSHIAAASPSHPGRRHVVSFLDSFSHSPSLSSSPTHSLSRSVSDSAHICIVFEPLGENLLSLISRHKQKGVPRGLVKHIAKQVLLGLQYLHEACGLVHTDVKPENILIQIPDIESHIHTQLTSTPSPTSRRVGIPLPPSSKPKSSRSGVTIPKARERTRERKQVQIFDSQPLGSPVLSGGYKESVAASLRNARASKHSTVMPVPENLPSISMSSSLSSMATSSASLLTPPGSSVSSTPPTSDSLSQGFPGALSAMTEVTDRAKKDITVKIDESGPGMIQSQMQLAMSSEISASSAPSGSAPYKRSSLASTSVESPTTVVKEVLPTNVTCAKPKIGVVGKTPVPVPAVVTLNAVSVSHSSGDLTDLSKDASHHPPACMTHPALPSFSLTPSSLRTSPTPTITPVLKSHGIGSKHGPSLLAQTCPREGRPQFEANATSDRSPSSASITPTPTPPSAPPPTPSSSCSPSPLTSGSSPTQALPILVKIADMGNATPASKHYTEDIQTRQYRAPEAIISRADWGFTVDVWSVACLIFELLTAEYLFDPQGQGELFSKDVDHYAQIIELLGDIPTSLRMGGKYSKDLFDSDGELRGIKRHSLKMWPLERVMIEKYLWSVQDARDLCMFLIPMLRVDWRQRSSAGEAAKSVWLEVNPGDWGDEFERET